ncbi:MAG: glycoside hydrolase family 13 protein [Ornithinimicrobium sp.]
MRASLENPHHDGSPLYVSSPAPRPGDTVQVRLRVPRASSVEAVHVRITPDGEQEFVAADRIDSPAEDSSQWWQAELHCHNPITNYRFLLSRDEQSCGDPTQGPRPYEWLNGKGLHERDVPDASDFRIVTFAPPPPRWALGSVVYQIFPDRFAREGSVEPPGMPGAPRTDLPGWAVSAGWEDTVDLRPQTCGQQVFGGTLRGVMEHLDHVEDLGANVIYLTPFFPARSNHRYDAVSFAQVDPILGGTSALLELQRAAHARDMMVLGDITTNHTGEDHEWFLEALSDPLGHKAAWYVHHEDADRADGYVSWLAVGTLPKLNHADASLRTAMFDREDSAIRRWLGPGRGIDGWRIDVANMTGRYRDLDVAADVARQVRRAVEEVGVDRRCEPLVIAEHTHDHSADAMGDGWHGVMNYSGFTKPVWTWLRSDDFSPKFLGSPVRVPRLGGSLVAETMSEFFSIVPWRTLSHSMTLLGSHDTTRIRTVVGEDPALVHVAAGLLFTLPGIPMVYYGDEIGLTGDFGEDGRRPMPWSEDGEGSRAGEEQIHHTYREMIHLRRNTPALHSGGLRWVHTEDDAMVFLREHPTESVLVHIARGAHPRIALPIGLLPGIGDGEPLVGPDLDVDEEWVSLTSRGPTVQVWRWSPVVPDWA